MKGCDAIIHMRMRGKCPSIIFINDGKSCNSKDWQFYNEPPTIQINEDESIGHLDLRFVVNTTVNILGMRSDIRTQKLFDKCVESGAKYVYTTLFESKSLLVHSPS